MKTEEFEDIKGLIRNHKPKKAR